MVEVVGQAQVVHVVEVDGDDHREHEREGTEYFAHDKVSLPCKTFLYEQRVHCFVVVVCQVDAFLFMPRLVHNDLHAAQSKTVRELHAQAQAHAQEWSGQSGRRH